MPRKPKGPAEGPGGRKIRSDDGDQIEASGKKGFEITRPDRGFIKIPIVGTSGYIPHQHSKAALDREERRRMQLPIGKHAKLNPFQEMIESLYIVSGCEKKVLALPKIEAGGRWKCVPGAFGIPAVAFKQAMIRAASLMGLKMTEIKVCFYIKGIYGGRHDLVPIEKYSYSFMRRDPKVVGMGRLDLRYRMEFVDWEVTLPVTYNRSLLSGDQILSLAHQAGFVGVGEERPGTKVGPGMEKGIFEVVL